jgi:hypothetical protein
MRIVVETGTINETACWLRLVGANGAIIMTSELYATRTNARRSARTLAKRLGVPAYDEGVLL